MKKIILILFIFAGYLVQAQGDTCATATEITADGSFIGSTTGASPNPTPFCGTGDGTGGDEWFYFDDTSGTGSMVTLTTCSPITNFDTKLRVYTGSCAAPVCVVGNDDAACASGNLKSTVNFMTDGSSTYYVKVHGFSSSNGNYELIATGIPAPAGPQPINVCGTGNPQPIPATGTGASTCLPAALTTSPANVAAAGIIGTNYSIESVTLNLTHTWDSDLDITLVAPSGTTHDLSSDNGGSGDNYTNTVFQDGAPSIVLGSPPYTGTFSAEAGSMNFAFGGQSITGNWTLRICDDTSGDTGTLLSYCINFAPILGDPPIISCPMDITVSNDPGECGAVVNFADAVAIDPDGDLDTVEQTGGLPSGSQFPLGDSVIEFTATDLAGNTAVCSFTITVEDNEDPVVICADYTAELDASGNITVFPGDVAGVTDNCPGVTLEFGAPSVPAILNGPFNSNNGQSGNMFDTMALSPITINSFDINIDAGPRNVNVYYKVGTYVGSENNAGAWTLAASVAVVGAGVNVPTPLNLSMNIVVPASQVTAFYITDTAGTALNYTNGTQVGAFWYGDANLEVYQGIGRSLPLFGGSIFSPRNINANIIYSSGGSPLSPSLDFDCSNLGPNSVFVTATDGAGNVSICSAVITVEDNTAPVIVCNGESTTVIDSTSDSPGLPIVDNTATIATMTVADDFVITDLDVDLNITHTWVGDLQITLESPSGTQVLIFDGDNDGCSGDNIVDRYDDESANPLDCQGATNNAFPLDDYIPSNALSAFDGESTVGDWILTVEDTAGGDVGTLNSWALNYTHDIVSTPLVVELDANGMATLDASALLLSIDEACAYTVTTGGGAPVPGSLGTLFGSNNNGAQGGAVYFDVTIGAQDINVIDLDVNTADAGPFTMQVYSLVGTYVGNEGNAGAWTLSATASGTGVGLDTPSNAVLDVPVTLAAGTTYGMALVMDATHAHYYTNGDGSNQNYSNADLSIALGAASNVPFDGSPFSPRVFNGTINYEIGSGTSTTIDFDCSNLGLNEIEVTVTDSSGNTASCTATVEVVDVTAPILVCMDAVVVLDENGMAEVLPEYFIDEAASFDACGITITAVDVTDVTCDDIGTVFTVTVFASDSSGNLASCTAEMTVVDETGPVIENCPEDQTVDPGPLNLFYELPDYWTTGTTATDNCTDPVTITSQDPPAGTLLPDGVYTITMLAEDEYGNVGSCTFQLTIESILGITDNTLENGVIIYPNPTKGVVNITNTTSIQLESAAIYDINGRMVQNINLSNMATEMTVDVSNLASGVYMVQIQGEGGQTVKRLIRE